MRYLFLTTIILGIILPAQSFVFQKLGVTAASLVTNATTTYTISYDHSIDSVGVDTAWDTTLLTTSDTVTVTFPSQYTLGTVTCSYSINTTASTPDIPNSCTRVGNVITLSNIFSSVYVKTLTLKVVGVLNPYPAGQTSNFLGTIGSDSASSTDDSSVIIVPATSACSFTFDPNTVYTNPANMIITITTIN